MILKIFRQLFIVGILFSSNLYSQETSLLENSEYFVDKTNSLKLEDIEKERFTPHKNKIFHYGYSEDTIWIRFKIKNQKKKDLRYYLTISSPFLEHISLHYKRNGKNIEIIKGKKELDKYDRKGIIHPFFHIVVNKDSENTYYLKIHSPTTGINFKGVLKKEKKFIEDELKYQVIQSLFFGVMAFLLVYNLLIFIQVKEKTYLYYILLLSTILLHHLSFSGMSIYLIDEEYFYKYTTFTVYYVFFANIFVLLFMRDILELSKYKIINHIVNSFVLINGILLIVFYDTLIVNTIAPISIVIVSLLILSLILFSIKKAHPVSKQILLGWLIKLIGVLSLSFFELGLRGPIDYFPYFFELSLVMEFFVFSNTLAIKLGLTKKLEDRVKLQKILADELQHRIKNNLQLIGFAYRGKLESLNDPLIEDKLNEAEKIIHTMGRTYEYLYHDDKLKDINTKEYFQSITKSCKDRLLKKNVDLELNIATSLNLEKSIYCGLIVNELITNSIKYAFKEKSGKIKVSLYKENNQIHLLFEDNGVGFDYEQEKRKNSFGLYFIETLSRLKLKATLIHNTNSKTKINIVF
ncbi:MAG: ATP-binding protein [Campylobacterales bacterium]|nr:ATP-binding protein [Campylobacterales bacterium]